MTGSTRQVLQEGIDCHICSRPISLENATTDESGDSVHEECYVRQTISKFRAGYALLAGVRELLAILSIRYIPD